MSVSDNRGVTHGGGFDGRVLEAVAFVTHDEVEVDLGDGRVVPHEHLVRDDDDWLLHRARHVLLSDNTGRAGER